MYDTLVEFWFNFRHNLFKPLLLFFYMGFSVPILKVPFEFPHVLYQGLTMYLLISIGWHGGEELAALNSAEFARAGGFMVIGFISNFIIGVFAYVILRKFTKIRQVDAATVGGYYGSDSAGTFVTCVGVLTAANIAYAAYMPVLLAVMEVPGCLVVLFLVSRLRRRGMDARGAMPGEPGYDPKSFPGGDHGRQMGTMGNGHGPHGGGQARSEHGAAVKVQPRPAVVAAIAAHTKSQKKEVKDSFASFINVELFHEVFLNPGLFLLFGGILIGFVSRLQGESVTAPDDPLFVTLFQGALCLFLLEMGMTACKRLQDLKSAGVPFVLFAIIGPNIFATFGILVTHAYSMFLGQAFDQGTYVLFSVLCAAASYIAVPAVQRLAIPEPSPTLPLAASLGCTFSDNVTIGIPVYMLIAKAVTNLLPVAAGG